MREYINLILSILNFFFYIGMVIMRAPVLTIVVAMCCCIYSPLRAEYLESISAHFVYLFFKK